jgi:hypothetical protein
MADANLPDLKGKDSERKKTGAAFHFGPGSAPFAGAVAAAGTPASSAASGLQAGGGTLLERLVARLSATLGGQLVLTGGLAVLLAGTLAAGHRLMFGSAASRTGGTPDLGALTSTVRLRRPKRSKALDYLAAAYKGELKLEGEAPAGPKQLMTLTSTPAPASAPPQEPAASPEAPSAPIHTDWAQVLGGSGWRRDTKKLNHSAAKLSDASGGQFGRKNVFANSAAPRFGQGFDRKGLAELHAPPVQQGKAQGFKNSASPRGLAQGAAQRLSSKRAMGQLKASRSMSAMASGARGNEAARALAANAFDGQVDQGGAAPAAPGDAGSGATVATLGTGAPSPEAADASHANATPYQTDLDNAYKQGAQAGDMKKQSVVLMILGLAMIILGIILLHAHPYVGAALIAVGAMLVGMSIMLLMTANSLAKQARATGDVIQRQYGQQAQNAIVNECMDQAINSGTRPENCKYKTQSPDFVSTSGQDARTESQSAYTVDDSGGAPVKPAQQAAAPTTGP